MARIFIQISLASKQSSNKRPRSRRDWFVLILFYSTPTLASSPSLSWPPSPVTNQYATGELLRASKQTNRQASKQVSQSVCRSVGGQREQAESFLCVKVVVKVAQACGYLDEQSCARRIALPYSLFCSSLVSPLDERVRLCVCLCVWFALQPTASG